MFWELQSTIRSCLFVPKLGVVSVKGARSRSMGCSAEKNIRKGGVEQVELREVMSV